MAPFAVTSDAFRRAWEEGRVHLPPTVEVNGGWLGNPSGSGMLFGFHELIEHAARTRDLPAGTINGSVTVSNPEHASVGSTCISEKRAIGVIEERTPRPFLHFGDHVRMSAGSAFGAIDQSVVELHSER
ncbi:fumarylacetoacetate hydrolase family protein [Sphingomonas sp. LB3N6]|uniref:fumarylacetoacetate hydrolase family protein n=1 Tax=Sphingomonas fucosidasi TaxID=3096164 RepID=UPI002FCA18A6